jgi:hypothetical protein
MNFVRRSSLSSRGPAAVPYAQDATPGSVQ